MEGGASRTIFSCGVTDVLMEENIYPDYFIGVSAGVAYGLSYVSGQRGRNEELTRRYMGTKDYMGLRHLLNPKKRCYYNLDFAFDAVPNGLVPYDYDAQARFPGKAVAVVTNVDTGQAEYLDIPLYEKRWETTVASCALPVLFPISEINGRRYLDGGLTDSVPYKQAFKEGCDKVIVILTRERGYQKGTEAGAGIINFAMRKYPHVVERLNQRSAAYNALMAELLEEEKKGNIFLFAPEDTFGIGRTEGNWERLSKLYEEGIRLARAGMDDLKAYLQA